MPESELPLSYEEMTAEHFLDHDFVQRMGYVFFMRTTGTAAATNKAPSIQAAIQHIGNIRHQTRLKNPNMENRFANDETWWTTFRKSFSKQCSEFFLDNGVDSKASSPIYREDFKTIVRGMMTNKKQSQPFAARAYAALAKSMACRGGEPKYFTWSTCYFDPLLECLVIKVKERKVMSHIYPMPILCDYNSWEICTVHAFASFIILERGGRRNSDGTHNHFFFPAMQAKGGQVGDAATYLSSALKRAAAFMKMPGLQEASSQDLRKGSINEIMNNPKCRKEDAEARSGHTPGGGTTMDKHYILPNAGERVEANRFSSRVITHKTNPAVFCPPSLDAASSKVGAAALAAYSDPNRKCKPPQTPSLPEELKQKIAAMKPRLFVVDVPELQSNGKCCKFVDTMFATVLMHYSAMCADRGFASSPLVMRLREVATAVIPETANPHFWLNGLSRDIKKKFIEANELEPPSDPNYKAMYEHTLSLFSNLNTKMVNLEKSLEEVSLNMSMVVSNVVGLNDNITLTSPARSTTSKGGRGSNKKKRRLGNDDSDSDSDSGNGNGSDDKGESNTNGNAFSRMMTSSLINPIAQGAKLPTSNANYSIKQMISDKARRGTINKNDMLERPKNDHAKLVYCVEYVENLITEQQLTTLNFKGTKNKQTKIYELTQDEVDEKERTALAIQKYAMAELKNDEVKAGMKAKNGKEFVTGFGQRVQIMKKKKAEVDLAAAVAVAPVAATGAASTGADAPADAQNNTPDMAL